MYLRPVLYASSTSSLSQLCASLQLLRLPCNEAASGCVIQSCIFPGCVVKIRYLEKAFKSVPESFVLATMLEFSYGQLVKEKLLGDVFIWHPDDVVFPSYLVFHQHGVNSRHVCCRKELPCLETFHTTWHLGSCTGMSAQNVWVYRCVSSTQSMFNMHTGEWDDDITVNFELDLKDNSLLLWESHEISQNWPCSWLHHQCGHLSRGYCLGTWACQQPWVSGHWLWWRIWHKADVRLVGALLWSSWCLLWVQNCCM